MKYASVWWDWWLNSNLLMLALTTLHIVRICNITDHPTYCSTCSGLQMEEDSLLVPPVENFLCGMESTSTLKLWWRWDAVALLHCNPTSLLAPYLYLSHLPYIPPSLSNAVPRQLGAQHAVESQLTLDGNHWRQGCGQVLAIQYEQRSHFSGSQWTDSRLQVGSPECSSWHAK